MSGGTDSSVSALLLKEQGYEVGGITFRLFDDEINEPGFISEARRLAQKLKIPHYTLDIRKEFEETVVQYFEDEFVAGRTPHPCAFCNNTTKWTYLVEQADKLGYDSIATGHYAQISSENGLFYVGRGIDPEKEQSFFLWGLPQSILSRTIFPLGRLTKDKVRQIAAQKGFQKLSTKKDSMGICFVPRNYRPFLENRLAQQNKLPEKGNFIADNGKVLGTHNGYVFYTVGQRRGLGINLNEPLYVTAIHPETNEVVLGSRDQLLTTRMLLSGCNFVDPQKVEQQELIVQIRYRKQATPGRVKILENNQAEVILLEPVVREAAGQTASFYDGDKVLGGGWIEEG